MALSASQMEWEPAIPGEWPTTPRINRKRTASAAGLKNISAVQVREIPAVAALQKNLHEASTFERLTIVLMAVAAITYKTFVAGGLMTYRAARSSIRGATHCRQTVVEIRRFTSDGFESVKRRATNIVRRQNPTPQEVARTRSQVRGPSPQRNRMGRTEQNTPSLTESDVYHSNSSSVPSATNNTTVYNQTRNPRSTHDRTSNNPPAHLEPYNDTEVPSKVSDHSTYHDDVHNSTPGEQYHSRPQVSNGAQLEFRTTLNGFQSGRSSSRAGVSGLSSGAGAAAVAALRPSPVRGLDIPSVAKRPRVFNNRKLLFIEERNRPLSKFNSIGPQSIDMAGPLSSFGKRTPLLNDKTQGWKMSTANIKINKFASMPRNVSVTRVPDLRYNGGLKAVRLSETPVPNVQMTSVQPIRNGNVQENTYVVREALDNSIEMTEAPKARQVRIALDSRNGLPKENVAKFFRASYCGDWEPSSPWDSERVGHTGLDLKGHLDSLKNDSFRSTAPPYTPTRKLVGNYPASIAPGKDPDFLLGPNKVFTPPDTEAQQSFWNLHQVMQSTHDRNVAAVSTEQSPSIESIIIVDNKPAQNPQYKPTFASTTLPQIPVETPERPARASPYSRLVERLINGVRKAVSLTPSPPRNVSQEAATTASPTYVVHQAIDTSIEMTDASPLLNPTSPSSLLDPPSIIDLDAIHDVGESPYGIGGSSTEVNQPVNDALDQSLEAEITNSRPASSNEASWVASRTALSKEVRRYDGSEDVSSVDAVTGSHTGPPTIAGDVFFELAMSEAMSQLGLSDKMSKKMKKKKVAKEAARAKEQAEKDAKEKAEKEAAEAKAKAEADEAARKSRFQRRLPKQKLVQPLSNDWETKIDVAMNQGGSLTTTSNGTDLTRHDLISVLGDRKWLNDEIINGYIDWVVDYANKKAAKGANATPKVVAQNSFFYDKLSKEGPSSVSRWMRRKKAAGAKLLEVETVLIPVNNAAHWTLIVVSPKARTIEYLDSFGGAGSKMVSNTKAWLKVELGNLWKEEEWSVLDTESAAQDNGYDCGVFVTTNAECVVGGISTSSYSGEDMTNQRRRIAGVLLNKGFGNDFTPAEEL